MSDTTDYDIVDDSLSSQFFTYARPSITNGAALPGQGLSSPTPSRSSTAHPDTPIRYLSHSERSESDLDLNLDTFTSHQCPTGSFSRHGQSSQTSRTELIDDRNRVAEGRNEPMGVFSRSDAQADEPGRNRQRNLEGSGNEQLSPIPAIDFGFQGERIGMDDEDLPSGSVPPLSGEMHTSVGSSSSPSPRLSRYDRRPEHTGWTDDNTDDELDREDVHFAKDMSSTRGDTAQTINERSKAKKEVQIKLLRSINAELQEMVEVWSIYVESLDGTDRERDAQDRRTEQSLPIILEVWDKVKKRVREYNRQLGADEVAIRDRKSSGTPWPNHNGIYYDLPLSWFNYRQRLLEPARIKKMSVTARTSAQNVMTTLEVLLDKAAAYHGDPKRHPVGQYARFTMDHGIPDMKWRGKLGSIDVIGFDKRE